jgi:GTP 3',8-cyclase
MLPGMNAFSRPAAPLIDPFGRQISYVRVSVTDRCDFRCVYCMSEDMNFLPKRDVLSLEELDRLCSAFVRLGTRKIRITGGEPLVRRNVMTLFHALKRIDAAVAAGLKVKLNAVALKGFNDREARGLIGWAHGRGFDLTFIEVMPLGAMERDRADQFLPLTDLKADLERSLTLTPSGYATGGPARYYDVKETGGRLGFITPLTHNFCESCNRVRVTCTGTLYMCLGREDAADLREPLRRSEADAPLIEAIRAAIARKPKGHDFVIARAAKPAVGRHMSATGG